MAGKIFISYRRDDSEGYAGRIYDRLGSHFGYDNIFMDVDMIEPGVDFVDVINDAIKTSDVVMILIGKRWMNAADSQGNRRLDKPEDFVRLEIASALRREIRVIPVLVGESNMPNPTKLPTDISALTRRNAIEITHARFNSDMNKLIRALESAIKYSEGLTKQAKKQNKKKVPAPKKARAEKKKAPPKPKAEPKKKKETYDSDDSKADVGWIITKNLIYLAVFWAIAWIGSWILAFLSKNGANFLQYQYSGSANGWVMLTLYGWIFVLGSMLVFPRRDYWEIDTRKIIAGFVAGIAYGMITWLFTNGPFEIHLKYIFAYPLNIGILILIFASYYYGPVAGFFAGVLGQMIFSIILLEGIFVHEMIGYGIIGLAPGLWAEFVKRPNWRNRLVWAVVVFVVFSGIPAISYFGDWAYGNIRGRSFLCAPTCGWTIYVVAAILLIVNFWSFIEDDYRIPGIIAAVGVALGLGYGTLMDVFWRNGFDAIYSLTDYFNGGFSPNLGVLMLLGMGGMIAWLWGKENFTKP